MICPRCRNKLEEEDIYCPVCGMELDGSGWDDEDADDTSWDDKDTDDVGQDNWDESAKKQRKRSKVTIEARPGTEKKLIPVIVAVCLAAAVIVGAGGALLHGRSQNDEDDKSAQSAETKEVDLSKVDVNAIDNDVCSLGGNVKKAGNGDRILSWGSGLSVYGLDENKDKVLVENVTSVCIDEDNLAEGLLDTIAVNEKVKISGEIHIVGNVVHLRADKILDENGVEITLQTETAEQAAEETQTENFAAYDYIIADSDKRLLTDADVQNLTLQQINYAKNEIYARHGRLFKSQELQNYFNSKSWYNGTIAPENFSESLLSQVEQKNAAFLSSVEYSISSSGYLLDQ